MDINSKIVAENIKFFRHTRKLTQSMLALLSALSLQSIKKIEAGVVKPRITTIRSIATALNVDYQNLLTKPQVLNSVRFRSCKHMRSRQGVIASVAHKLKDYNRLESLLNSNLLPIYKKLLKIKDPIKLASSCRQLLGIDNISPIASIIDLVEDLGIKILSVSVNAEKFFGLSLGESDGGPAIVVNCNKNITYEQTFFAIAHELGHLLLHQNSYQKDEESIVWESEDEADLFASYFLLPERGFNQYLKRSDGLDFADTVINLKHIYAVGYKTILHRMGDYMENLTIFMKTYPADILKKTKEPEKLAKHLYPEKRLSTLVLSALKFEYITLNEASEILDISEEKIIKIKDNFNK